jgi:hypothetical protein
VDVLPAPPAGTAGSSSSAAAPRQPRGDLAAPGEAELGQHVLDVRLDGALGDVGGRGDLAVG